MKKLLDQIVLKQLKTSERQMLQNIFDIGWIQHFSCENRAIRFIQPPSSSPIKWPLTLSPHAIGPQVLLAFMTFLQQSIFPDLLFHCFSEDSCFEISSTVENFVSIFCSILCRQRYLIFVKQKTLNEKNGVKG